MIFVKIFFIWYHFAFFNEMNNLAGMRHYVKEKVLGPAKPLWFVRGDGFTMEANMVYEIAWENNSVQTGGMLKDLHRALWGFPWHSKGAFWGSFSAHKVLLGATVHQMQLERNVLHYWVAYGLALLDVIQVYLTQIKVVVWVYP